MLITLMTAAWASDRYENLDALGMQYGPCPTVSVEGYVLALGYGSHKQQAEALKAARQDAHNQMLDRVAAGYSELRRASIGRHIVPWMDGEFDRKAQSACAAVALSTAWLDTLQRDLEALEDDMGLLAAVTRAAVGDAEVLLVPPIWSASGCSAAEVGAHLQNTLQSRLAGVRFVDDADDAGTATQLRMALSASGSRVQLTAALRRPGEVAWTQLDGGLRFPRDLFELEEGEAGQCRAGEALGLTDSARPGSAGLWGRVEVPAPPQSTYCEGDTFLPAIALSDAARVRIYAVDASGEGYQVWSSKGRAVTWSSLKNEPVFRHPWLLTRTDDGSDTQLIVAAAPPDGDFGSGETDANICRLTAPFHAAQFPAPVALHMVSYQVADAGHRLCSGRGDAEKAAETKQRAEAMLAAAPDCP